MTSLQVRMRKAGLGILIALWPVIGAVADLPRIGILFPGAAGVSPAIPAFEKGLTELGWHDGQNIKLEYRYAEGKLDRLPAMAKELADLPVKVIVAVSGEALIAAHQAIASVPIVSATGDGDFVAMGLIASWDRPGGNVTGMNMLTAEAARKRVEIFKQAMPSLSRLAVLVHTSYPASPHMLPEMEAVAEQLNVQILPIDIAKPEELDGALTSAKQAGAQAVSTLQGPFFFAHRNSIAELAMKHKLPLAMGEALAAEAGAFLQVSVDIPGSAARSASFVDRILKGAHPAELPIERFNNLQTVFNLKVARELGITFDQTAIQGAKVIE